MVEGTINIPYKFVCSGEIELLLQISTAKMIADMLLTSRKI